MLDQDQDRAHPATVLVVDDSPDNLAILGGLLEPHFHVRVANSGPRALRAAQAEPPADLMLLDLMMPGMDGYEVLARLRRDERTRDLPVILVTARDADADEQRGLDTGAVDYVTKPVRPAVLLARVRAQLELKRARDLLRRQNDALEQEVARRMRENELVKDVGLLALATLAETRDPETGQHLLRTQGYVRALAEQAARRPEFAAQLDPDRIQRITKASPLHDLGKVGIPDHILLKPGRFTPEELAIMKTHAALGADAIARAMERVSVAAAGDLPPAPLAFLEEARQIALGHHERWDGGGYPQGLAGERIPLAARLMSLADVFDAMTCRRVYKPALPWDEVVPCIVAGRGSQFDPRLVEVFLEVQDRFREVARHFCDPVA